MRLAKKCDFQCATPFDFEPKSEIFEDFDFSFLLFFVEAGATRSGRRGGTAATGAATGATATAEARRCQSPAMKLLSLP